MYDIPPALPINLRLMFFDRITLRSYSAFVDRVGVRTHSYILNQLSDPPYL